MARQSTSVKRAAELLGATPKWIRARIAEGSIAAKRANGRSGRYAITDKDLDTLRGLWAERTGRDGAEVLARITRLESERDGLLTRLAWEHATAEASRDTLEEERRRGEALAAEVAAQRSRVEQLKALSLWDRLLGRHKSV